MKQINLATGFIRDVKVVINAPAIGTTLSDDTDSVKKQLRACQKEIMTLKELVVKLEANLLAVNSNLAAVKSEVNRVSAKVSIAKPRVSVLGDLGYWESCDSAQDSYSDDDY